MIEKQVGDIFHQSTILFTYYKVAVEFICN